MTRAKKLSLRVASCCVALLLGLCGDSSLAQDPPAGDSVFVPAPRELTRPIELAWEALEKGRYAEAVDRFGEVLFAEERDNYFVPSASTPGLWSSLRVYQQQLLEKLPPEARDLFELKFGIEARQLLDRAIEQRDWETIMQIAQDYVHCKAGYDASMILGRRYLDEGRPAAAARSFEQVLQSETGRQLWTPDVQLLGATALLAAGRKDDAIAALATLPDQSWKGTVGGETLEESLDAEPLAAWLSQRLGEIPNSRIDAELNWLMFRGNAQRTGISSSGFPLLINRWRVPTMLRASDRSTAMAMKRRWIEQGQTTTPATHAIAVGDVVVMRTPDFIVGVELSTGLRTWYYPWDAADNLADPAASQGLSNGLPQEPMLQERMWLDNIHGQMTSDGQRVFFVDSLGYRSSSLMNGRVINVRAGVEPTHNTLVALRLYDDEGRNVEGKMDWIIGGQNGNDQPWSAGVFFLGPPLPIDGTLYVLGETASEVKLFAIDPLSAQLQWSSQVAITGIGSLNDRTLRQLCGATPSAIDNLLLCPTSTGAIVAVDLISHAPLWGFQYRPVEVNQRFGIQQFALWSPGEKWNDSTVLLGDGVAVLTPIDHQELLALDIATGVPLWKRPRDEATWVSTLHGQSVILVSANKVEALDLRSGEVLWTCSLQTSGAPSGHGYVSDSKLFLPTILRKVIAIDLASGEITDSVDTEYVLGNLVCHNGAIVSHDVDWVAAFYQDESNRLPVTQRLEANPNDVDALLIQAQLQARDRDWDRAIQTVEQAVTLNPESLEVQQALVDIVILATRNLESIPIDRLTRHESLLLASEYREEFLIRKTEFLGEAGRYDEMVASLLEMLRSPAEVESSVPSLIRRRDQEFAPLVWARVLLQPALADTNIATQIVPLVQEARAQVVADNDLSTMLKLDAVFGQSLPDAQFELAIARGLVAANRQLEAEQRLVRLMDSADESIRAETLVILVQALDASGFDQQARELSQTLVRDFEGIALADGRAAAQVGRELLERDSQPTFQPLASGRQVVEASDQPGVQVRIRFPLRLDGISGPLAPNHLTFGFSGNLILIQGPNGVDIATVSVDDVGQGWSLRPGIRAHLFNHMLVVETWISNQSIELIGIDLYKALAGDSQPIVWRQRLWGDGRRVIGFSPNRNSTMVQLQSRVSPIGLQSQQLSYDSNLIGAFSEPTPMGLVCVRDEQAICIDPLTGATLWRRSGIARGSRVYAADDNAWFVSQNDRSALQVRLLDGSTVATLELESAGMLVAARDGVITGVETQGQEHVLTGIDLKTGSPAWRINVAAESRAMLCDDDRLALLEPDGRARLIDLGSGEALVEARANRQENVASIQWVTDAYGHLLIVNHNALPLRQEARQMSNIQLMAVMQQPLLDGEIYAFDHAGNAAWPSPVMVDQYSVLAADLSQTPVIPLARSYQTRTQGVATLYMDLALVDRRDGRLLWDETAITGSVRSMTWNISYEPTSGVTTIVGSRTYTVKPTDTSPPPAPAALTGSWSSGFVPRDPNVKRLFDGVRQSIVE